MSITKIKTDRDFIAAVETKSGVKVSQCYQCMKCTAGCPIAEFSDSSPAHVMRSVTLGLRDEILDKGFIWLCSGCETCASRCPQNLSARKVNDALKVIAQEEKKRVREKNVELMNRIFMNIVSQRGRVNEPLMMGYYKLGSRDLFGDLDIGRQLVFKGKMGVNPLSGRIREYKKIRKTMKGK